MGIIFHCRKVPVLILFHLLVLYVIVHSKTYHKTTKYPSSYRKLYNSKRHVKNRHYYRPRRNDDEGTICDLCHITMYDTPFYCPVKPDLSQCMFPVCPKICEDTGGDPTQLKVLPPPPPKKPSYPHPITLPQIPEGQAAEFTPAATTAKMQSGRRLTGVTLGSVDQPTGDNSATETFPAYNPETCEFPSPNLRRLRPGSKYIEYRPSNQSYQISDIQGIATKFGLALAEFRHPMEWYSVEKSSIMESVSTYKMTEEQPRLYYAVGLGDNNKEEASIGSFQYKSDNTDLTFAVFDPKIYGRWDERCGVLSHVMGTEKRQYLTTRFWNCKKYMGDGKRVVNGLFMFPPGSVCHQRSEEECALLQEEHNGGDSVYHNIIQIGQTLKRFIYLFTDQRSWQDAFILCKAKGLHMLDFDIQWGDSLRTGDVIEHFLREARLNPVTSFWTSGRFERDFMDGKFSWATTGTTFETQYNSEPPPFAFSWWDDQKVNPDEIPLSRRGKMRQPCVSVALNPETGGERPKINFKAWYCDFPMYVLCYKELNATDKISEPTPLPITAKRSPPHPQSCEKPPDGNKPPTATESPGTGGKEEEIDPFTEETCSSESLTVKRLTPNSKFVDYQPKDSSHSVEQIKEQCVKYGLLPAEIRTREDWEAVEKSGIGGIVAGEGSGADYFYAIGMDDSKEFGKIVYGTGDMLTFSMFSVEVPSEIAHRCSILQSVQVPGEPTRGLMMLHADCREGLMSNEKIAYGLCMFPPTWSCFTKSTEETAAAADKQKFTTIIPLGVTETRSIFFNPVQRSREDAIKFSEAANLTLLDFDAKWGDTIQLMKIFRDKLVKDGGFFQLTSLWTSGKLEGAYSQKKGTWETTGEPLVFPQGPHFQWLHLKHPHLARHREGVIESGCVEVIFDNAKSLAKFHPDYCDLPKYFLMYRVHKRRGDPIGINHLGINIIETGPRQAETSPRLSFPRRPFKLMSLMTPPSAKANAKNDPTPSPQKREIDNKTQYEYNNHLESQRTFPMTDIVRNEYDYDSSEETQDIPTDSDNLEDSKDDLEDYSDREKDDENNEVSIPKQDR